MHLDVQAAPSPHDCQADNPEIAQRLDKRAYLETSPSHARLLSKPAQLLQVLAVFARVTWDRLSVS